MPRRTSAKTLRRKPPLSKALLGYANDALALHNRLLKLAARVEETEVGLADRTPGDRKGELRPRPCIDCGGLFAPDEVGTWQCKACASGKREYPGG